MTVKTIKNNQIILSSYYKAYAFESVQKQLTEDLTQAAQTLAIEIMNQFEVESYLMDKAKMGKKGDKIFFTLILKKKDSK